MLKLDWQDIALHAIGALVITFVLCLVFGPVLAFVLNAAFWIIREVVQDYNKGYKWPLIWPLRRSSQKDMEGGVPVVVGLLVAFFCV